MDFAGEIDNRQLKPTKENISDARICESGSHKMMHTGGNDAKLKTRL
jgi:hypothetical protein